jgi:metal-dependent hydrolase (beta-lactamase superfamily II)
MAAGHEMAERTVPLLRRPWPVLLITTRTASSLDAMMLSHGHWDHAGAMPRTLQMMTLANGGRRVPTYMHPDMFASRAVKANDGRLMPMEDMRAASTWLARPRRSFWRPSTR